MDRWFAAEPEVIRPLIEDAQRFMEAGQFDEVTYDGRTLTLANVIGFARIELTLNVIDDADAALAYEQDAGLFEEMQTRYTVHPEDGGTRVRATTEFRLGGVAGTVLDSTIIKRQRRREIHTQFEYLQEEIADH